MICLLDKSLKPTSNICPVITVKLQAKEIFVRAPCCYFAFYKKKNTSTKYAYLSPPLLPRLLPYVTADCGITSMSRTSAIRRLREFTLASRLDEVLLKSVSWLNSRNLIRCTNK